jgi:hypothetical protein
LSNDEYSKLVISVFNLKTSVLIDLVKKVIKKLEREKKIIEKERQKQKD